MPFLAMPKHFSLASFFAGAAVDLSCADTVLLMADIATKPAMAEDKIS